MDSMPLLSTDADKQQTPGVQVMPAVPMPVPHRTGGGGKRILILIAVLVLMSGGYAGSAFYFKFWPFQQGGTIDKELAFADFFSKLFDIQSATYTLNADAHVEPRQQGVSSYQLTFPELEEEKKVYKRDNDRFRSLNTVLSQLWTYQKQHQKYPSSLAELAGTPASTYEYYDLQQPQSPKFDGTYAVIADSTDFSLVETFETTDAIQQIAPPDRSADKLKVIVSGKSVTFHKESATQYPSYYFYGQPKVPSWVGILESQNEWLGIIPADFSGSMTFGGTTQRHKDAGSDSKFHAGVTWNLGDLSAAADADLWKKADTYYGRISKFPSFGFFDISKIKGQWIKATPEDFTSGGSDFLFASVDTIFAESEDRFAKTVEQVQLAFKLMADDKLLNVDFSHPSEKVKDRVYYVYPVTLNEENVASWYEHLASELASKYGPDAILKLDESTLKVLRSDSFKKYLAYVKTTNDLNIVLDAETGNPARIDYHIRYIPSEKIPSLKDKQFALNIALHLQDINKPITVDEPTPYLTFEDAYLQWTGQSKEEYRFSKQAGVVRAIRTALANFRQYTGNYPDTLSQLAIPRNQLTKKQSLLDTFLRQILGIRSADAQVSIDFPSDFQNFSDDGSLYDSQQEYYENRTAEQLKKIEESPFMRVVPKDVFSGKEFVYSRNADDYALLYQMNIPPRDKRGIGDDDFLSYRSSIDSNTVLGYVQGANTATAHALSTEATAAMHKDSDGDKLPDAVENYYGSSNSIKDSDKDGYDDYNEVQKGYDPAGPGTLSYNDRWYAPSSFSTSFNDMYFGGGNQSSYIYSQDAVNVRAKLTAAQPGAVLCQDRSYDISSGDGSKCSGKQKPMPNKALCSGDAAIGVWPSLPTGYSYLATCYSDHTKGSFSYAASNGLCTVTCSESKCEYSSGC